PAGRKIDTPVYLQDIMPTTLELAGAAKPDYVQFRSLMPLIAHRREGNYEAVYGGYLRFQRMVTMDGWKLMIYPAYEKMLLFDLRKDPYEMHDVAGDPSNRAIIRKLMAELLKLQKQTGDTLDLSRFAKRAGLP
ncbi:MAG: DUF4976 domain-containing protein, partial [Planctomycetes bacterium]|nr:DUF4976 domain-containing protein [Planctomycetota bacterium]